jgi:phage terminase large subunit-like protein
VVNWLEINQYEYECGFDLGDFKGCFYLGALDLAETSDLCSARILLMKPDDNRKYIFQHYFIPESKLEKDNDDHNAGAKYKEWVKDGYMTIAGDTEVNMEVIADWFYSLYENYHLKLYKVGYDQKFALDWLKSMEDPYGWTRKGDDADLVLIMQNAQTLSAAINLCETEFTKHLVQYGNNPVDRWCLSNAGLKVDRNGSLIIKKEKEKRIDGAVTYAILFETLRRYRSDFLKLVKQGG